MSVQNFSFLARLEVAEKFVVVVVVVVGWGGVGWWWSRPSLGFSFSQAEQLHCFFHWKHLFLLFYFYGVTQILASKEFEMILGKPTSVPLKILKISFF